MENVTHAPLFLPWLTWSHRPPLRAVANDGKYSPCNTFAHRGELWNKLISVGYQSSHPGIYKLKIFKYPSLSQTTLTLHPPQRLFPFSLLSTLKSLLKNKQANNAFLLKVILNGIFSANSNYQVLDKTIFSKANYKGGTLTEGCHINPSLIY